MGVVVGALVVGVLVAVLLGVVVLGMVVLVEHSTTIATATATIGCTDTLLFLFFFLATLILRSRPPVVC